MSALELHTDLPTLFINSFLIFGIYYAFHFETVRFEGEYFQSKPEFLRSQSNILGWFHFQLRRVVSEYWCKPIFGCCVCMASVWGTIFSLLFIPNLNVETWLVQVVAVAGINSLLKQWLPQ